MEYNRGFPVNRHSLNKQAQKDRSVSSFFTIIQTSNGDLTFEGKPYTQEKAQRLVALCEALDTPTREDAKIRETLLECLGEYLKGTKSLEDTVRKIEDSLKMYLAE